MRIVALALLLAVSACASEHPVRVRFDSPDLREMTTRVGVYLVQSCPTGSLEGELQGVVAEAEFDVDESAPALGEVEPGEYGLLARTWNDECELVAAACRDVRVEAGGSATLSVQVNASAGNRCTSTQGCSAGLCISADGIVADSGTDALDSGTDAPADAGSDTPPPADSGNDGGNDSGPDTGPDTGPEGTFCSRHGNDAYTCLDFESPLESNGWLIEESRTAEGMLVPDRGISGSAARFSGDNDESFALVQRAVGPHTEGVMWARLQVQVAADDAAQLFYMNLFALNEANPPNAYMTTNLISGRLVQGGYAVTGAPDETPSTEFYPLDTWFCVELELDNTNGVMRVYVDEVEYLMQNVGTDARWDTVFFGPRALSSGGPVSILVDDFLWGPSRVPCSAI